LAQRFLHDSYIYYINNQSRNVHFRINSSYYLGRAVVPYHQNHSFIKSQPPNVIEIIFNTIWEFNPNKVKQSASSSDKGL